jgi:SanA protein
MSAMWRLSVVALILGPLAFILPRLVTALYAWPRIYRVEEAPAKPAAIVFGAGLRRDGSPTRVLRDRVATAAELYFQGKAHKLLMSGDNKVINYNEPAAMKEYAMDLGVPAEDIVLDYAGRRTYDTCLRAKEIFQLEDVILVTQQFHLPRAIYTCNYLGVTAVGVPANQHRYRSSQLAFWNLREAAATWVALWDVHVSRPEHVLGSIQSIFPREAQ